MFRSLSFSPLPLPSLSFQKLTSKLNTILGFSTSNFDLSGNLSGDQRAGLDDQTLTELRRIMERNQVNFDEARRIQMERMFKKAGIGPDGLPIG